MREPDAGSRRQRLPVDRTRVLTLAVAAALAACQGAPREPVPPLDPQAVQDQDDMTWDDYRPIPGTMWADSMEPERDFKLAVLAMDFPDQPFVITLPTESDPFGNPQVEPIPRDSVSRFYADFFAKPGAVNHGQTINGYWMEQSRGKFGITQVDVFGPYRMPVPLWAYGLNEYGQNEYTPDGSTAHRRMEPDVDSLWAQEHGDIKDDYDAVLRIYAGYDETGVWQEFGEMKFSSRDDITEAWGNPNPEMPDWVPTRYVEWTSWLAGSQQWGLSSMRQGENSGTITHELGHFAFHIPDLNNNPYVEPYRRVAAGPWDMMDRGSFNGPGGPHRRWVVPPIQGAAMPAGLMLRSRMATEFLGDDDILTLSRDGLAATGPAVARVTDQAVTPMPGELAGVVVRLDGAEPHDRTPADDPATNPLSPGIPDYDFYSMEVVQRIGYDSFTPDDGVLLAKNKDSLRGRNGGPNGFNSFIWVIDAHPEDIDRVDFVKPDGDTIMRTIADYRQLNDALFHAGLDSGSEFEWTDEYNRLHFYVIDLDLDDRGIRSYTVGVRSLDGSGPQQRGVTLDPPGEPVDGVRGQDSPVTFALRNTGTPAELEPGLHPDDAARYTGYDIYRLDVELEGQGWKARLRNALAAVPFGQEEPVTVYVTPPAGAAGPATVTLRARSESDPTRSATASVEVSR